MDYGVRLVLYSGHGNDLRRLDNDEDEVTVLLRAQCVKDIHSMGMERRAAHLRHGLDTARQQAQWVTHDVRRPMQMNPFFRYPILNMNMEVQGRPNIYPWYLWFLHSVFPHERV